ncbi:hypothetical protein TYRP_008354 [Tyrophagus putrescentiae]|nr:hypothetical protein TYRP_008354 [Tyrophagus putrescentiae]
MNWSSEGFQVDKATTSRQSILICSPTPSFRFLHTSISIGIGNSRSQLSSWNRCVQSTRLSGCHKRRHHCRYHHHT